jgi:hypothetical protein
MWSLDAITRFDDWGAQLEGERNDRAESFGSEFVSRLHMMLPCDIIVLIIQFRVYTQHLLSNSNYPFQPSVAKIHCNGNPNPYILTAIMASRHMDRRIPATSCAHRHVIATKSLQKH